MPLADGDAPEMDASLHRTRRGGGLRVLTVAELTKRVALTPAVAQLVGPNGAIVILADADTCESGRARHDDRHAGNELVVRVREPKRPAVQLMAARHATSCKHAAAGGYELDSSRHGPGPAARHIVASRTDQWEVRRAPAGVTMTRAILGNTSMAALAVTDCARAVTVTFPRATATKDPLSLTTNTLESDVVHVTRLSGSELPPESYGIARRRPESPTKSVE